MKASTKKLLSGYVSRCEALKEELQAMAEKLREAEEALQETYDGRSENWQDSEAAEAMKADIDALSEAASELESGNLEEVLNILGNMELD